eukprot:6687568-Heterocapsa_arctica.AAC.1
MESSVQAAEYSLHLRGSTKKLAIIDEPSISPFAGVVNPGVFMSAVNVMTKDHSSFKGAVGLPLSSSSVDGDMFSTG